MGWKRSTHEINLSRRIGKKETTYSGDVSKYLDGEGAGYTEDGGILDQPNMRSSGICTRHCNKFHGPSHEYDHRWSRGTRTNTLATPGGCSGAAESEEPLTQLVRFASRVCLALQVKRPLAMMGPPLGRNQVEQNGRGPTRRSLARISEAGNHERF